MNAIFGKWHLWSGTVGVMLSDETAKKLRQFPNLDACINWLFLNDEKSAARELWALTEGQK